MQPYLDFRVNQYSYHLKVKNSQEFMRKKKGNNNNKKTDKFLQFSGLAPAPDIKIRERRLVQIRFTKKTLSCFKAIFAQKTLNRTAVAVNNTWALVR